jgi:hypothetical protein
MKRTDCYNGVICRTHAARTADTSQGQKEETLLYKKRKLSWIGREKLPWTGRGNSSGLEEKILLD